jgi:hypothetical protein|tara:strand:+ start:195 stop:608 length:414 start_codon:yes stop_codon:yes gene_type:complete
MPKNQLFKKIPTKEILNKVLLCFDIQNLQNSKVSFCRKDIVRLGSVSKLNNITDLLKEYYLPCKARTYLNDLNEKNIVTILRQILKHFNYNIISKEKYLRGEKFILYNIIANTDVQEDEHNVKHLQIKKKSIIINFD